MPKIAHTASEMISGMSPELRLGSFVFASVDDQVGAGLMARAVSMFREDEGLSLLLPAKVAETAGLPVDQPMRCITLNVYSSLEGVGLTAAVATALAENGIACNMVAAFHHDHAFVPEELSETAMQVLKSLQASG
ncbi:ACT domain-containing protein [Sulfitobacter mediterraneus]|uniref:DUF2241 domain-containing protein n=1 Tax=Sulfitobacter mediterraneus TaxID=83219 RepID=A0A061STC6_9RHOB|nr:ACT domain-containing protein [Sulfitobacter mediterraneus]KAJ02500.1 hypothetical protein PM02_13555 [Sulfitobacter mediterraneus]